MDLDIQLSSGYIKRYHTLPLVGEQTVASHTYGVVQILRHITDDDLGIELLKAALDHDVLEYFTGDIPHPTKVNFEVIKEAVIKVEDELMHELGIEYNLTLDESHLLHIADLLEMGHFGKYQSSLGNEQGRLIVTNVVLALKVAELPDKARVIFEELSKWLQMTIK